MEETAALGSGEDAPVVAVIPWACGVDGEVRRATTKRMEAVVGGGVLRCSPYSSPELGKAAVFFGRARAARYTARKHRIRGLGDAH